MQSLAPNAKKIKETFVQLRDPLPAFFGAHPEACDWISYLRWRHREGPRKSKKADAVYVLIPGFIGGASSFDGVARTTIKRAAKRGRDVEVWGLDRRSNCLEDHTGVQAAAKTGDSSAAYDYYWNGKPAEGRTFSGWVSDQDAAWLENVGLKQTMDDWYTVLKQGVPGQRRRARKVICGGHSLGGPLTTAFASWDFDGNKATTRDAGYRQCAAFVGFDTRLLIGAFSGASLNPTAVLFQGITASPSPYVNVPPLTPETFQIPDVFSVDSYFDPQGTDLLPELPHTTNIDLAQRLLFSRDAAHFATQMPDIRDFTLTNQSVFAGVFDDNSQPLSFLRASLGGITGGPLVDKNFPSPDPTLALPEEPSTPLYSWETFRQSGAPGHPLALNDDGVPYSSRESEVTNLGQFARIMFDAPANLVEQYFPTKILSDIMDAGEGNRSGDLAHLMYDGIAMRPAILINAKDSSTNAGQDSGLPEQGEAPNKLPSSRHIKIPGYNHLDVVAAAVKQNDRRPEPAAKALTRFGLKAIRALRR